MLTYNEKFEKVKYFHSLLKWFSGEKTEKSFENLSSTINNLSRNKKLNSLMHLYFVNRSVIPHDFDVYSIISECTSSIKQAFDFISKYKKKFSDSRSFFSFQGSVVSFFQMVFIELGNYLANIDDFVKVLDHYFSTLDSSNIDADDISIEYFGFCTLPSLFGFFAIPDFYKFTYQLSINLISTDSLKDLGDYFVASLFFNTPSFLNFLWDDYFNQFITANTYYPPFKYFEFFVQSLKKASNFLLSYHYLIAKKLFSTSSKRFLHVMVKLLFLPTLDVRIISDSASHIYEVGQISCFASLKNVFNHILANPLELFSRSIFNALKIEANTEANLQYIHPLKIIKFNCYMSVKEIILFANILIASEKQKKCSVFKHQAFPKFFLKDNSILYNEFFFHHPKGNVDPNWTKVLHENDKLFFYNFKEIELIQNESYSRKFLEIRKYLNDKNINIISVIDDRFPLQQENESFVLNFRKFNPILNNDDFKDFVITKIFNEYSHLLNILENQMIVNNIIQSNYKEDLNIINRLYFMYLNAFIPFDDCFSTKSLRYKLTSLPAIKENAFDESLKYLIAFTMQYNNSFFDKLPNINNDEKITSNSVGIDDNAIDINSNIFLNIDAFKNMEFSNINIVVKRIQELNNIVKFMSKMDMNDRIVICCKIFKGIHEIIISQSTYSFSANTNLNFEIDKDYNHYFLLFIIFLFSSLSKLLNLYETYCTFFKYAFSQFEDEEDIEMIEVKIEWIRFQNVLKQTILKERNDCMEICLLK